jgi:hypothetical protein
VRRHERRIIVLDALQLGDLPDRAQRGPPILRTRSAMSSVAAKICLFVGQRMVVAEMWTADMPVEILVLNEAVCRRAGALRALEISEQHWR